MPSDTVYLVERYLPGIEAGLLSRLGAQLTRVTETMRGEGKRVEWVRSLGLEADEACLCLFRAASPELVAEANDRAGLDYERISQAVVVGDEL